MQSSVFPSPSGLFPYPRPPREGSDPTSSAISRTYRVPRGGIRKDNKTSPGPNRAHNFEIEVNSRVKVRSKAKFWRFFMMKLWADGIKSFCWKLGQSDLKCLLKIYPVSISFMLIAKYGLGSRSGSGHERSPKPTIRFRGCDKWFIVTCNHTFLPSN